MTDVNKEKIFNQVKDAFEELFEIEQSDITLESLLYEDFDLDSIDAVDLIVYLQNTTGEKIKPNEFSSVRTVGDIVDSLTDLLKVA